MKRKNREFLMLAKTYDPDKHQIAGYYASIKRDGQRAFWDGGVSRGKPKEEIPWANTDKDSRYVNKQICTGLWSRYGNVIHAPDWWINDLPSEIPLDGELYIDRGQFQETRKIVSRLDGEGDWHRIKFLVFEMPSSELVFKTGKINNPNFQKQITWEECADLVRLLHNRSTPFQTTTDLLRQFPTTSVLHPMEQIRLSRTEKTAREQMYQMLDQEVEKGGEGLILRAPYSYYDPVRSNSLLKVKPCFDSEATVIDYTWGVGKLEGLMGALVVRWGNVTLSLSGFTDEERMMCMVPGYHGQVIDPTPGTFVSEEIHNPLFPRGSIISFRYVSLTDDNVPREARYLRK